jgi:hypothetical protein
MNFDIIIESVINGITRIEGPFIDKSIHGVWLTNGKPPANNPGKEVIYKDYVFLIDGVRVVAGIREGNDYFEYRNPSGKETWYNPNALKHHKNWKHADKALKAWNNKEKELGGFEQLNRALKNAVGGYEIKNSLSADTKETFSDLIDEL